DRLVRNGPEQGRNGRSDTGQPARVLNERIGHGGPLGRCLAGGGGRFRMDHVWYTYSQLPRLSRDVLNATGPSAPERAPRLERLQECHAALGQALNGPYRAVTAHSGERLGTHDAVGSYAYDALQVLDGACGAA